MEEGEKFSDIIERVKSSCEKLLKGKGHWKFKKYLDKLMQENRDKFEEISNIIKDFSELYPKNADIQYIFAYTKYIQILYSGKWISNHGNIFNDAIQLGSIEAEIESILVDYKQSKTWDTPEKRLEWLGRGPAYTNNGYLYYTIADAMIKYDYDIIEHSKEDINECIKYLEKAIELGAEYAKYKLSYVYIKYLSKVELGINLYQEAEEKYHHRYYGDWQSCFNLAYYWRHRDEMIDDLLEIMVEYQDKIYDLQKENKKQRKIIEKQESDIVELRCRPGGPDYLEAMDHFLKLQM